MSTATHDCPRAHISRAQPAQQGFDLSVLAPYLETSESTEERAFPPVHKPSFSRFLRDIFKSS